MNEVKKYKDLEMTKELDSAITKIIAELSKIKIYHLTLLLTTQVEILTLQTP